LLTQGARRFEAIRNLTVFPTIRGFRDETVTCRGQLYTNLTNRVCPLSGTHPANRRAVRAGKHQESASTPIRRSRGSISKTDSDVYYGFDAASALFYTLRRVDIGACR